MRVFFGICLLLAVLAGTYFRASGLFRGLADGVVFHPDAPKQVTALYNYLDGSYVQYYNSLFYDGYPYGLNRVDELFLRVWRRVVTPLRNVLYTHADVPTDGDKDQLYYQGRVLRVLYGIFVMGFLFATAKILWGPWHGLGAVTLYGLAPLGSAVTHSVTGDVGVDLFISVLLFLAARFVRENRLFWFVLMGAACGMGFACKFQGLLGIWIIFLLMIASLWQSGQVQKLRPWKGFGLCIMGFVVGVLLLNPAFLIDASRTWRYMRHNFVFIKNYNVPQEFIDLPLHEKVIHGLSANLFPMINHVGIVMVALAALVGLWLFLLIFRDVRNRGSLDSFTLRKRFFGFGISSFSLGALLLATGLKRMVQPFHFSFLLPPLALVTIWGIDVLCQTKKVGVRILAAAFFMLATGSMLTESIGENYFWQRPENTRLGMRFADVVSGNSNFGTVGQFEPGMSNFFFTEPAKKPVFRNRPSGMRAPTSWWASHSSLPFPPVPYPGGYHWIFMHGADYPRSTRMYEVPAGKRVQRTLVYRTQPSAIRLGIQTGYRPSRFSVKTRGNNRIDGFLTQHGQQVITLDNLKADYAHHGNTEETRAVGMHIEVKSELGPVWVTVLDDELALERFRHFGVRGVGATGETLQHQRTMYEPDVFANALRPLLYHGSSADMEISDTYTVLTESTPLVLASGAYVLHLNLEEVTSDNRVYVRFMQGRLRDERLYGVADERLHYVAAVSAGTKSLAWHFEKNFIPFDGVLEIRAERPGVTISGWELKPDSEGMVKFMPGPFEKAPWADFSVTPIVFPDVGTMHKLLVSVEDFLPRYALRFDLHKDIRPTDFANAVAFLHVKNERGEMVSAWDIPLWATSLDDDRVWWHDAERLPAGRYFVDGGVYHVRTRLRFPFQKPEGVAVNMRRKYVRLADFEVFD